MIYILVPIMKRREFDSLPQEALWDVCFKPLIDAYKDRMVGLTIGESFEMKEQFYKELTLGQQALFTFHVYYDHAIQSLEEFYWWSAYFMAQPKIWSAIKSGFIHIGDHQMLEVVENLETVLKKYKLPRSLDEFNVAREDLIANQALLASIRSLHNNFSLAAPSTLQMINNYIRSNLKEFVIIED